MCFSEGEQRGFLRETLINLDSSNKQATAWLAKETDQVPGSELDVGDQGATEPETGRQEPTVPDAKLEPGGFQQPVRVGT